MYDVYLSQSDCSIQPLPSHLEGISPGDEVVQHFISTLVEFDSFQQVETDPAKTFQCKEKNIDIKQKLLSSSAIQYKAMEVGFTISIKC